MAEDLRVDGTAGEPVPFTLDGKAMTGRAGDTVASALHANGVKVLARSIRYHRPRGYFCGVGKCANCLMRVDGVPNARACVTPLEDGMAVEGQNGWPSARHDVLGIVDRVFAGGLDYHERFLRPAFLKPLYDAVIRRMAGFGAPPDRLGEVRSPPATRRRVDVAVVGGGPAGLAAARAAAAEGASVLLVEERDQLGGDLRLHRGPLPADLPDHPDLAGAGGPEAVAVLAGDLNAHDDVVVLPRHVAFGLYPAEGPILAVDGPSGLLEVHPRRVVLAPGTYEAPPLFPRNDLPGILGARAALLLLERGVLPGRQVVVAGHDPGGLARRLEARGVRVPRVVDRTAGERVRAAHGRRVLEAVTVTHRDGDERIPCDALVHDGGRFPRPELLQQAGVALDQADAAGALLPTVGNDGATDVPWCLVAGSAAGPGDHAASLRRGAAAGARAAREVHSGGDAP